MKRNICFVLLLLLMTGPALAYDLPTYNFPKVYTLADNGQTATVHVNDMIILDLGTAYNWAVSVDNSNIVNVINILTGKYLIVAKQVGGITLTATGDPKCRQSRPACAMPSRMFELYVDVR